MTVQNILESLSAFAPVELKMERDNVGLLCGHRDAAVDTVLVALDVTMAVAQEAAQIGAQLIVVHHPLLHSISSLTDDTPKGALCLFLAEHRIAVISMHTNLDAARGGVNDVLAQMLELNNIQCFNESGLGRIGETEPTDISYYVNFVKKKLQTPIRYVNGGRRVCRVAVGSGACMDALPDAIAAGCDTYVTGDVKYHQFMDAQNLGINLIDAGHFPTENPICPVLVACLQESFPALSVKLSEVHRDCIQFS